MTLDRHRRALELHLAGASYSVIADTLGYASKSGARQAVARALKDAPPNRDVDEAATTELARLDAMLTGLWPKARKGDAVAVGLVLRIEERRSQVLGRDVAKAAQEGPQPSKENVVSDFAARLAARQSGA